MDNLWTESTPGMEKTVSPQHRPPQIPIPIPQGTEPRAPLESKHQDASVDLSIRCPVAVST